MLASKEVRPAVQLLGVASGKSTPLDVFTLLGHVAAGLGGLAGRSGVGSDSLVGGHFDIEPELADIYRRCIKLSVVVGEWQACPSVEKRTLKLLKGRRRRGRQKNLSADRCCFVARKSFGEEVVWRRVFYIKLPGLKVQMAWRVRIQGQVNGTRSERYCYVNGTPSVR